MNSNFMLLWVVLGLYLLGCLLPFLSQSRRMTNGSLSLALAASGVGAFWTGSIWLNHPSISERSILWESEWFTAEFLNGGLPSLIWELRLDALSAFYGFLITAFAAVVAVYSFGALSAPHYKQQQARIAAAFNLFVATTLLVVLVNDIFSLIVTLELMTLSFGYLTMYKHILYQSTPTDDTKASYRAKMAPQIYMIISHASTTFLLVALLMLAIHAGSLSFDKFEEAAKSLPVAQANIIFLLVLAGAGIRAGLTPGHIWVPLVHPASPTTTHAFSLGIAIKVAIYLMVRFFFQFLPVQPWWGFVVIVAGVITALVNVWYAIASHDLKTALAYHSIENVGIIVAGLGIALLFAARPNGDLLMVLGLTASLYHTLNHAVFKGLLYLATGAIDNLTGQVVAFHKLGGLIKLYPWTSVFFFIGAVSISGFPPFNGFVSEWLTVQAVLKGAYLLRMEPLSLALVIAALVMLAAAFALTAFCFYKMVGLTFLGQPRTPDLERMGWSPRDVPVTMVSMMGLMAILCLLLGIFPGKVTRSIVSVTAVFSPNIPIAAKTVSWQTLALPAAANASGHPIEMGRILIVGLTLGMVAYLFGRKKAVRRVPTAWNCGTDYHPETMQA
ncbi:MAG: hypothetical protein DWQ04_02965, partial [Chloroflexi bacterium]